MSTAGRIGVAFLCTTVSTALLALVTESSMLAGLPGALFIGYVARSTYRAHRKQQ